MELNRSQRLALDDAQLALVFLEAADRVIGPVIASFEDDLEMMPPASFLIAHAVEISLNAFLRFKGKKGGLSRHDLEPRLAAAEAVGLEPTAAFRQYVKAIDKAHQSGQFRYARGDFAPFVMPRKAIEMVRPVLEGIKRELKRQRALD
jgi:HEPN domain-containing protein